MTITVNIDLTQPVAVFEAQAADLVATLVTLAGGNNEQR